MDLRLEQSVGKISSMLVNMFGDADKGYSPLIILQITIHHDTRPPEANSATLPFVQNQSLEDPTCSLVSQDELELETVNKFNNLDNEEDCYFKECYCGKKCKGLRSKIMQCTRSS